MRPTPTVAFVVPVEKCHIVFLCTPGQVARQCAMRDVSAESHKRQIAIPPHGAADLMRAGLLSRCVLLALLGPPATAAVSTGLVTCIAQNASNTEPK